MVADPLGETRGRLRRPAGAYSQGLGSMITEPPADGQRTPLQESETLYIGDAEPAVARRVCVGHDAGQTRDGAKFKTMRDCERSLTTTMARTSWGRVQWNKHEVER